MKRILLAALIAMLLILTGCSSLNGSDDISAFITANEELLTDAAVYGQYHRALILPEVYNVHAEHDCIVFVTGASGILTDTRCGFYYSYNGEPAGAGYANSWRLTAEGDSFFWRDNLGRMDYHTRRLFGNWYYFEGTW